MLFFAPRPGPSRRRLPLAETAAIGLLTACHFDATAGDPIASRTNMLLEEADALRALACECRGSSADTEPCGAPSVFEFDHRRCIEDAFAQEPTASIRHLDCRIPLDTALTDCIDMNLRCTDPGPTRACEEDYRTAVAGCTPLPESVALAVEDCGD